MMASNVKTEKERRLDLRAARKSLKENNSTLCVLGYYEDTNRLLVKCAECAKEAIQYPNYLLDGKSCFCQKGVKTRKSYRAKNSDFFETLNLSARRLFVSEPYIGMAHRVSVKCLRCDFEWKTPTRNLKDHGCFNCALEKTRRQNLKKHGVEFNFQRKDVRLKTKKTMLRKYGVEHALQNRDLFDKNLKTAHALKDYRLGKRIVRVQGFEPQALDYLQRRMKLKARQLECGIGNSVLPKISYSHDGKSRVYHPDIFIPHLNRIVEVKSEYTYLCSLEINRAKRKACREAGFKFTFLVMNKDGTRNYDYK